MKNNNVEIGSTMVNGARHTVYIASRLTENARCIVAGTKFYLHGKSSKQVLLNDLAGMVSHAWQRGLKAKKDMTLSDGLAFGDRVTRIELVPPSKIFPYTWDPTGLPEVLRVANSPNRDKLLLFALGLYEFLWNEYRTKATRRALRREKAVVDCSAAFEKPKRAPRRGRLPRPRVTPGQLLPADERGDVLAAGDDALKRIMGQEGANRENS